MTDIILDNVKWLCKCQNRRISELEKQAGVSYGYLSRCRHGKCILSIDTVKRMADILKVKVDDLIKEQEKPHFYKEDDDRQKSIKWRCSVCGSACYCYGGMYYKFCPNCGREMTGGVKK